MLTAQKFERVLNRTSAKYYAEHNDTKAKRILKHLQKMRILQRAFLYGAKVEEPVKKEEVKIEDIQNISLQEWGLKLVNTVNPAEKVNILKKITQHGKDATNVLLDEFGGPNGDIEVRVAAAEGLGKLRSRESVPSLIAALAGQTTPKEVKKAAVFALGEIGDKRGAEFLREFLGKEEGCLADVVREVLEKLNK